MSESKAAEQWCYDCHQGYGADYIVLCPLHAANRELLAAAKAVLEAEDCPCGDQGFTARQIDDLGNAEQEQCEFCYTNPRSRFNTNNQLRAAITKCEGK